MADKNKNQNLTASALARPIRLAGQIPARRLHSRPVSDFDLRFGGIQRLYSADGLRRLRAAHVCVVGIGGVGSWAVEALARSGIGNITMVDLDDVCVTNINRQLPAFDGSVGRSKVSVMAERIRAINPECRIHAVSDFFTETTAEEILTPKFDYVLDAIDKVTNKCLLIARCREKNYPVVSTGGAGGRRDPGAVLMADLAWTNHDALLQQVRKKLRDEHGFPREAKKLFGVPCVFSQEPQVYPGKEGTICAEPASGEAVRMNCDTGYGSATFVTGTFGFFAAAHIVSELAKSR